MSNPPTGNVLVAQAARCWQGGNRRNVGNKKPPRRRRSSTKWVRSGSPDPRWASELEKKQMLAAQTTNG